MHSTIKSSSACKNLVNIFSKSQSVNKFWKTLEKRQRKNKSYFTNENTFGSRHDTLTETLQG